MRQSGSLNRNHPARTACILAVLILCIPAQALACIEFPGLYDARSTGMGGTGAAYLDGAGAIYANPAALDQIQRMSVTVDNMAIWNPVQTPMPVTRETGMRHEPLKSEGSLLKLFFAGGAYRFNERIVTGAAIYPTAGYGSTYKDYQPAPEINPNLKLDMEASIGMLELAFPVALKLRDDLAIALMWRATYFTEVFDQPVTDAATGLPVLNPDGTSAGNAKMELTDWNLKGFEAGIFYRPLPGLRLGMSYRNKIRFQGQGDTGTLNPADGYASALTLETSARFASPHMYRAGVALSLLEERLLLAADIKYILYRDANKTMTTTTTLPDGSQQSITQQMRWENVLSGHLGAEYRLNERLTPRLGYSVYNSATPKAHANLMTPTPGIMHGLHAGLGVNLKENLSLDLGGIYLRSHATLHYARATNPDTGAYKTRITMLALALTYSK